MAGFDEGAVYYTNQELLNVFDDDQGPTIPAQHAQVKFAEFFRNFQGSVEGKDSSEVRKYSDELVANRKMLKVDLQDVHEFDPQLGSLLVSNPTVYLPLMEAAASSVLQQLQHDSDDNQGDAVTKEVQVCLHSSQPFGPKTMRDLASSNVSQLVQVAGIITAASKPKNKATYLSVQCKDCRNTQSYACKPGFGGTVLPRNCPSNNPLNKEKCGLDPWVVLPSRTKYVDQQSLKMQERPEDVPVGDLPRTIMMCVDRNLVCQTKPGTRVLVTAIFSIYQAKEGGKAGDKRGAVALRQPYLRVVGMQEEVVGESTDKPAFKTDEEQMFREFAASPSVLDNIFTAIAPQIFGHADIKKAVACLLFGGSRKRMPDGTFRRGDINVLLLGDPSTAKSQFLKFASKTAPIAVYTSGKGSSAAGLTASVIKDGVTGEFYLEAGAMVLADNGVVCIDEFDKMRPEDRVAIHEAMEQQTISIAKAGITTMLRSRTSVLAAANPPSGRYDDLKSAQENIDLQSTILSRFDLIFIVKDERSMERDRQIAKFVMDVHRGAKEGTTNTTKQEDDFLKKYIQYAKHRCFPRLSQEAADTLVNEYVQLRQEVRKSMTGESSDMPPIPVTVRQLEAIVRIAESLARMSLQTTATGTHVRMAMDLFQISTMDAVKSGITDSIILSDNQRDELRLVEAQIKRRIAIGSYVNQRKLVDELVRVGLTENIVSKALIYMASTGDLELKRERRLVHRLR